MVYVDIDVVFMVDDTIKKHSGLTVDELYKKLPKKLAYKKYKGVLIYFLDRKYILVDDDKHITLSGKKEW